MSTYKEFITKYLKDLDFYKLCLVMSILIGIFTRLWGLDIQSLWFDEIGTEYAASFSTAGEVLIKCLQTDINTPLYYMLMHFWVKIFGMLSGLNPGKLVN